MQSKTIPLVGSPNSRTRNFSGSAFDKDQWFRACNISRVDNPATQSSTFYIEKRTGLGLGDTVSNGNIGTAVHLSPSTNEKVSVFGSTSTVFSGTTNCGTITSGYVVRHISEVVISSVTYYLLSAVTPVDDVSTEGYYLASDSFSQTSYTGTLTSGSPIVQSIASTAGMYSGQAISGTGIPANTRILTVDSGTQITMNANATANGAQTITKTPVAKIIDVDFPSQIVGQFVEMDGYVFIGTQNGRIYNSDLNSVSAWSSSSFASANQATDGGAGLAKLKDQILAFGANSIEYWYNAGNAAGSPLSRTARAVTGIGAVVSAAIPDISLIAEGYGRLAFCSGLGGSGTSVYLFDGFAPAKISNGPVEDVLRSIGPGVISFYRDIKSTYVVISVASGSSKINLRYCIETGLWDDGGFSNVMRFCPGTSKAIGFDGDSVAIEMDGTSGKVFEIGRSGYIADNGVDFTLTCQTSRINFGTNRRKFVRCIRFVGDKQDSGVATLEYSIDDFATFVTLGTFDMTSMNPTINRPHSFVGGASYRLTHSAATLFRAEALEFEFEIGSH